MKTKLIKIEDKRSNQIRSVVSRELSRWVYDTPTPVGDPTVYTDPNLPLERQWWWVDRWTAYIKAISDLRKGLSNAQAACLADYLMFATDAETTYVERSILNDSDPFAQTAVLPPNVKVPSKSQKTVADVKSTQSSHGCLVDTWQDPSYAGTLPELPGYTKAVAIIEDGGQLTIQHFETTQSDSDSGFQNLSTEDDAQEEQQKDANPSGWWVVGAIVGGGLLGWGFDRLVNPKGHRK
jgi:hypothetical protein